MNARPLLLALALGLTGAASAQSVYLALGDSVAYGFQPVAGNPFGNAPSNGDRGYVAPLANALGAGGTRPTVVNLAIPSETSTSFRDLTDPYRGANTNYGPIFTPRQISQYDLAVEKIALYGSSIKTVSYALGANDLLSLLTPSFLALSQADQQTAVAQKLAIIQNEYVMDLTAIRSSLPGATLILPGYYNPYPAGSAYAALGTSAITSLNAGIRSAATAFGGRYVDFYTPIVGRELQYTHIGDATPDIHPTDAGYATLGIQAAPEPATWAALGLGALGLLRRRKVR